MKKFLALTVSLAMLMGVLTVSASAAYMSEANKITGDGAGNTNTAGTAAGASDTTGTVIGTKDVTVNIKTSSEGGTTHVYAVAVDTTELTFTWSNSATTIWNPETLKYETSTDEGSWTQSSFDITVTNYSDVGITVTPSTTTPDSADAGVTVAVSEAVNIDSAYDGTTTGTAKTGKITVTVSGEPESVYADPAQLATFTLNVTRQ